MGKDLTIENPMKLLLLFALPMLVGLFGQQIYVIVDSMIVGEICGDHGIATISAVNPIINIPIAIYSAISLAVGVIISQLFRCKKENRVKTSYYNFYGFFCNTIYIFYYNRNTFYRYITLIYKNPIGII